MKFIDSKPALMRHIEQTKTLTIERNILWDCYADVHRDDAEQIRYQWLAFVDASPVSFKTPHNSWIAFVEARDLGRRNLNNTPEKNLRTPLPQAQRPEIS